MTKNSKNSLKTLGMISLIFFVLAFECGDDKNGGQTTPEQTTTTGGACSSEAEFKAIITKQKTFLDRDNEKSEVIFNSFDVEGPMHYQNTTEGFMTVTDNAYRVVTSFDKITRGGDLGADKVHRMRFENSIIMFYPYAGSSGECKHFYEKNGFPKDGVEDITDQY